MSDTRNLGAYVASVAAQAIRENSEKLEQRMAQLVAKANGSQYPRSPRFGNPVYLGGEVHLLPGATGSVVMKVSASRDLQILALSISQDGTPADRLDPWQSDVRITSYRFTSMTKDDEYEHIIDGEIMLGDLFGRDDGGEHVIDIIKASQDVSIEFRNTDALSGHRVNVNMKCAFWPPILYGLREVTEANLFDPRP
jgi:hypothetical protein